MDFVSDVIDQPKVVFVVGGDAVCAHEPSIPKLHAVAVRIFGDADSTLRVVIAPHVDEVTVRVENEYGNVSTVEDVHVVFGVDGYSGCFTHPDAVWNFRPSGHRFVVSYVVEWEGQGCGSP